jgi:DNA invertase Pin-like site-specific DNA recombinase
LQDGDTLTVWKLDRLARSLRDLIAMVEDFTRRGVNFRSRTEEISTTTPGGKLTFHIFAALAEFERGLIIERRPSLSAAITPLRSSINNRSARSRRANAIA